MSNWTCAHCQTEKVEVDDGTLEQIRETLRPNFKTLAAKADNGWWKICPLCDQYALGAEMVEGFPVRTRAGSIAGIESLLSNTGLV
jgi:hypothetical protein